MLVKFSNISIDKITKYDSNIKFSRDYSYGLVVTIKKSSCWGQWNILTKSCGIIDY